VSEDLLDLVLIKRDGLAADARDVGAADEAGTPGVLRTTNQLSGSRIISTRT